MIKKMISILFLVACSQQSSGAARPIPDTVHAAAIQPSPQALRFEDLSEPVPQWDPMPIMMDLPYCLHYGPDRRVEPASSNSYRVRGRELRYGILPRPSSLPDGAPRLFEIVGAKSLLPGGNFRNAFHEWAIDEERAGRGYLFDLVRIFSPAGLFEQDSDGNTPLHLATGSQHFVKALHMAEVILTSNFGDKGMQEILGLSNSRGETVLQQVLHTLYYSLQYGDSEEALQPLINFIQLTAPLADLDKRNEHGCAAQEFLASPRDFFNDYLAHRAECATLCPLFFRPQVSTPATTPSTTSNASPVEGPSPVLLDVQPAMPPQSSYAAIATTTKPSRPAQKLQPTAANRPAAQTGRRAPIASKTERGRDNASTKPKSKSANRLTNSPAEAAVAVKVAAVQAPRPKAATVKVHPSPKKAVPIPNSQIPVSALFDEESDDDAREVAQDARAIKPATPAIASAPTDDGEPVLWKALEEKNLRTLAQWLRVEENQVRLKTGRLWNAVGETPLYKALSLEFYKGADALVAAAPHCLISQKNRDNAETPLTFIFDHASIRELKELFQLWYTCGEIDPIARVKGQLIEQRAMASGLLEPDQMETPAAAAPLTSRAEAKPMPVKPLKPSAGPSLAMLQTLWDGDFFFNASRPLVNVIRPSGTETRVCRAIESNNTKFLKKNEEAVQAYQRFMQHRFLTDSAQEKVWSLTDKYPIALWHAFLADATQSFSYFLSKIDDINPLLFYADDSSSIFAWLLDPVLLTPCFLALRRGDAFSFNSSRIAMLALLFKHPSFDYRGRLRKTLASATEENFISRFIYGLARMGDIGDVNVLTKLVFELFKVGVPWEDIDGVIQMKYSDDHLAQSVMAYVAQQAMSLYIKNDLRGFLGNYPCPVGMMAAYGFLACIEDLVNGGVRGEVLTGTLHVEVNGCSAGENALSILLLHRPLELQKELLPKYLTWAPLEKWLEPFSEERRAELLEKIKAVEAAKK